MGLEEEVGMECGLLDWADFIFVPGSWLRGLMGASRQGIFKESVVTRILEPVCYGVGSGAEGARLGIYICLGWTVVDKIINY